MAKDIMKNLIQLTLDKKKLLENILGTLKIQSRFIDLEKLDAITNQFQLKEKYMSQVEKLDLEFFLLFSKLKSELNIDSLSDIDIVKYPEIKDLKETVSSLLSLEEEIKALESENINKMNSNIGNIGNKLKAIKQGKKVANIYNKQKNVKKYLDSDKNKK